MWDLIVSVPDHCLSFNFSHDLVPITNVSTLSPYGSADLFSNRPRTCVSDWADHLLWYSYPTSFGHICFLMFVA